MSVQLTPARLPRIQNALEVALDCIGDLSPRVSIKNHAKQLDGAAIELRYLLREVQHAIKEGRA